ncbi:MAG: choice-of-anchor Q domain-containing protein [Rudaea sp.]
MQKPNRHSTHLPRRLAPLAAAVMLAFGHTVSASPSSTIVVQNCNDHGTGSLRAAVNGAASGSTIDLSQLSCSTITLTGGSIQIPQAALLLSGPGASQLTIDGGASTQHYNRIIHHTGTGQLTMTGLTLTDAKYKPTGAEALGACVYSKGLALISGSTLTGCIAVANNGNDARGAAIAAENGLTMLNSSVTGNLADSVGTGNASGGGIYCNGPLTMKYSTVSSNSVLSSNGLAINGGGIITTSGDVVIFASTIANNYSAGSEGGILISHPNGNPDNSARIINSTISGNRAARAPAGLRTQNALTLANSTVAFNAAQSNGGFGGGIQLQAPLNLQSSIVADNSSNIGDDDLYTGDQAVTGANNLVTQHSGSTTLPIDTITSCPLLGPLSDNGGTTLTHRLLTNSPALDAGNNDTGFSGNPLSFDQRGDGHPRTFNGVTDIGAFEYGGGTGDEIFRSGFEGRCR